MSDINKLLTKISDIDPDAGIGDKSILAKLGIKNLIDLPGVGENLQVDSTCPHIASFLTLR